MELSLQDFGAIGEFLGFFAVIATLGYLSIQTSQAKRVAASETARGTVADYREVWSCITKDQELAIILTSALNDWNSIEQPQQLRAHAFLCDLTAHYIAASKAAHIMELEAFLLSWEDNLLGALQTAGGSFWWGQCQFFFDPAGVKRLNNRILDKSSLPPSWTSVPWWKSKASEEDH